jgi:hypothetical protein
MMSSLAFLAHIGVHLRVLDAMASLALVTCLVALFPAASDSEISFNQINRLGSDDLGLST